MGRTFSTLSDNMFHFSGVSDQTSQVCRALCYALATLAMDPEVKRLLDQGKESRNHMMQRIATTPESQNSRLSIF